MNVPILGDQLEGFEWQQHIIDKLASKHDVFYYEVEECFYNTPQKVRNARDNTYLLLGRTYAGRYLAVVFIWNGQWVRVITARDMDDRERRAYRTK